MSRESRSRKSRETRCRECGRRLELGHPSIKVSQGLLVEMGTGVPHYLVHEACLDALSLMLMLPPESFVTLEKSVLRG